MLVADQVCSPEQAQFFDSVGIKLHSTFLWLSFFDRDQVSEQRGVKQWAAVDLCDCWMQYSGNSRYRELKQYKAYNGTELGMMLPPLHQTLKRDNGLFTCSIATYPVGVHTHPTEARAKGALLQLLIEKGHLTVAQLLATTNLTALGGS